MPTITKGSLGEVMTGSNAIANIRDWSIEQTGETTDSTVMGDSWMTHEQTLKGWTCSCNVYWDPDDTNGQVALTLGSSFTLNLYPEGDDSGDSYFTGTATVTSISNQAAHDGLVEGSFTFTGDGALTITTVSP